MREENEQDREKLAVAFSLRSRILRQVTILPVGLVADAVTHDFRGIRDDDEGVGIDGVNQPYQFW